MLKWWSSSSSSSSYATTPARNRTAPPSASTPSLSAPATPTTTENDTNSKDIRTIISNGSMASVLTEAADDAFDNTFDYTSVNGSLAELTKRPNSKVPLAKKHGSSSMMEKKKKEKKKASVDASADDIARTTVSDELGLGPNIIVVETGLAAMVGRVEGAARATNSANAQTKKSENNGNDFHSILSTLSSVIAGCDDDEVEMEIIREEERNDNEDDCCGSSSCPTTPPFATTEKNSRRRRHGTTAAGAKNSSSPARRTSPPGGNNNYNKGREAVEKRRKGKTVAKHSYIESKTNYHTCMPVDDDDDDVISVSTEKVTKPKKTKEVSDIIASDATADDEKDDVSSIRTEKAEPTKMPSRTEGGRNPSNAEVGGARDADNEKKKTKKTKKKKASSLSFRRIRSNEKKSQADDSSIKTEKAARSEDDDGCSIETERTIKSNDVDDDSTTSNSNSSGSVKTETNTTMMMPIVELRKEGTRVEITISEERRRRRAADANANERKKANDDDNDAETTNESEVERAANNNNEPPSSARRNVVPRGDEGKKRIIALSSSAPSSSRRKRSNVLPRRKTKTTTTTPSRSTPSRCDGIAETCGKKTTHVVIAPERKGVVVESSYSSSSSTAIETAAPSRSTPQCDGIAETGGKTTAIVVVGAVANESDEGYDAFEGRRKTDDDDEPSDETTAVVPDDERSEFPDKSNGSNRRRRTTKAARTITEEDDDNTQLVLADLKNAELTIKTILSVMKMYSFRRSIGIGNGSGVGGDGILGLIKSSATAAAVLSNGGKPPPARSPEKAITNSNKGVSTSNNVNLRNDDQKVCSVSIDFEPIKRTSSLRKSVGFGEKRSRSFNAATALLNSGKPPPARSLEKANTNSNKRASTSNNDNLRNDDQKVCSVLLEAEPIKRTSSLKKSVGFGEKRSSSSNAATALSNSGKPPPARSLEKANTNSNKGASTSNNNLGNGEKEECLVLLEAEPIKRTSSLRKSVSFGEKRSSSFNAAAVLSNSGKPPPARSREKANTNSNKGVSTSINNSGNGEKEECSVLIEAEPIKRTSSLRKSVGFGKKRSRSFNAAAVLSNSGKPPPARSPEKANTNSNKGVSPSNDNLRIDVKKECSVLIEAEPIKRTYSLRKSVGFGEKKSSSFNAATALSNHGKPPPAKSPQKMSTANPNDFEETTLVLLPEAEPIKGTPSPRKRVCFGKKRFVGGTTAAAADSSISKPLNLSEESNNSSYEESYDSLVTTSTKSDNNATKTTTTTGSGKVSSKNKLATPSSENNTLSKAEPIKKTFSFKRSIGNVASIGSSKKVNSEEEASRIITLDELYPNPSTHPSHLTSIANSSSNGKNTHIESDKTPLQPDNTKNEELQDYVFVPFKKSSSFKQRLTNIMISNKKTNINDTKATLQEKNTQAAVTPAALDAVGSKSLRTLTTPPSANNQFHYFQVIAADDSTDMMVRLPAVANDTSSCEHTFEDLRREIEEDAVADDLPFAEFKFTVEAGGMGVHRKQEKKWRVGDYDLTNQGDGSYRHPYRVYVKEDKKR